MRHTAIKLELAWQTDNRSNASKLEYQIKHLNKTQKENIILNPENIKMLEGKINLKDFKNIK